MDWTSFLIGFGGLLLGAFTAYLSYLQRRDDRTAKYREALYMKQIEASVEIMNIATEHLRNVRAIVEMEFEPDKQSEAITKAFEGRKKIREIHDKWIVFMPIELHHTLNLFSKKTNEVLHAVARLENDDLNEKNLAKYQSEIRNAYYPLVEEMRKIIGTDPLSTKTVKFIGDKSEGQT